MATQLPWHIGPLYFKDPTILVWEAVAVVMTVPVASLIFSFKDPELPSLFQSNKKYRSIEYHHITVKKNYREASQNNYLITSLGGGGMGSPIHLKTGTSLNGICSGLARVRGIF